MNCRRSLIAAALVLCCPFMRAQESGGPGTQKWAFSLKRAIVASPALNPDETVIYIASVDGRLMALSLDTDTPEGIWTNKIGGALYSSPIVATDGTIYIGGMNGYLYSVSADGVVNWRFRTQGPIMTSPALGEDGTVFVGSRDRRLHAVRVEDAVPTQIWSFDAGGNVISSPTIAPDGTIYITAGATVFGVSSNGTQTSSFEAPKFIQSNPAVSEDGTIYFGANDELVYGVDPGSGTNGVRWRFNTLKNVVSSPAIAVTGRIYIGSDNARVYCFTTNGTPVWRFVTRGAVRSPIAIGADGTVYAGSDSGRLYAITPEGSNKWAQPFSAARHAIRSSPAIGSDGTVYVTAGRTLYAINDDATAAEAPWPMFRKDAQHTARATLGEPSITMQPVISPTNFVSNGTDVTIRVKASSAAPVIYQWALNGVDIDPAVNRSATNATLTLTNVTTADAGVYTVTVSNEFGEVTSDEVTLFVESAPVIVANLTNRFVSVGSVVKLEVAARGDRPFTNQWFLNGVPIPGADDSFLTFTNTAPGSNSYYLVISNAIGTTFSTTVSVVSVSISLSRTTNNFIAAGNRFSAAIITNGLFTWGSDASGQLADGGTANRNTPTRTLTNVDWMAVSAGGRGINLAANPAAAHALGLRLDGSLFAWGANGQGQLGLGSTNDQRTPVQVGSDTNWVQVEAGAAHSVGLKRDGTIWAWGANEFGQLGLGTSNSVSVPTQVGLDSAWVEVRAGGSHTLARRADNTIWAWGKNESGQLGIGSTNKVLVPTRVGSGADWLTISAGVAHSLGVRADHTLWTWGRDFGLTVNGLYGALNLTNVPSQLGSASNWMTVDAGYDHSLALDAGGRMFAWGANNVGQLGNGVAGFTTGNTNEENLKLPVEIAAGRTWTAIQAGVKHSVARASDGTIWAWGWNNAGQVGDGTGGDGTDLFNRDLPVQLVFTNVAGLATNNPPAVASITPASQTVPAGSNATFIVSATGYSLFYQWRFNGSTLASATNASLTITNVQTTNAGSYDVVITNLFGSVTSSVVTLSVSNAGPLIVRQPSDKTPAAGETNKFLVVAMGDLPMSFQWRFNLTPIASGFSNVTSSAFLQVSNIFTITNVSTNDVGSYDVIVSNRFGSVTSSVARLTLFEGPGGLSNVVGALKLGEVSLGTNAVTLQVMSTSQYFVLEYKNSLEETNWTAISTNEGSGGAMQVIDPAAPAGSRIYRLRVP